MPASIPSITDLGRHAAAASALADHYDKANFNLPDDKRTQVEDRRQTHLTDRDGAFRNLLVTFRAKTLSDVAVQLFAWFCAADGLVSFELTSGSGDEYATILRRVILSALPVVAAAAELDLAEIGAGYIPRFADREFPPHEDGSRDRQGLPDERTEARS
jgi:hypothetical protein